MPYTGDAVETYVTPYGNYHGPDSIVAYITIDTEEVAVTAFMARRLEVGPIKKMLDGIVQVAKEVK